MRCDRTFMAFVSAIPSWDGLGHVKETSASSHISLLQRQLLSNRPSQVTLICLEYPVAGLPRRDKDHCPIALANIENTSQSKTLDSRSKYMALRLPLPHSRSFFQPSNDKANTITTASHPYNISGLHRQCTTLAAGNMLPNH